MKKQFSCRLKGFVMLLIIFGMICNVTYWSFAVPCTQKGFPSGTVSCDGYDFSGEGCEDQTNCVVGYYDNPNKYVGDAPAACLETGGRYDNCRTFNLGCGGAYACELVDGECVPWVDENGEAELATKRGPTAGVEAGDCGDE